MNPHIPPYIQHAADQVIVQQVEDKQDPQQQWAEQQVQDAESRDRELARKIAEEAYSRWGQSGQNR